MSKIVPNIPPSLDMVDNMRREPLATRSATYMPPGSNFAGGPVHRGPWTFFLRGGIVAGSSTLQTQYAVATDRAMMQPIRSNRAGGAA